MKFKNLIFLFAFTIICSLSFLSCGDDDDGSGNGSLDCNSSLSVNNAVSDEAEAVSLAASTWGMDPSADNCTALKTAYQNYIDALNSLLDCANDAGIGDDFAILITLTESGIGGLIC